MVTSLCCEGTNVFPHHGYASLRTICMGNKHVHGTLLEGILFSICWSEGTNTHVGAQENCVMLTLLPCKIIKAVGLLVDPRT